LEVELQQKYFIEILDRLIRAPINLYHEVTPIGRILGYFGEDLRALDSRFFEMVKEIFDCNLTMFLVMIKSVYNLPSLMPIFIYYIYVSYRNKCIHQKCCDTQWRMMHACNEKAGIHVKLTYSGRAVIKAHDRMQAQEDILYDHHMLHQGQHRPLIGILHRQTFCDTYYKYPALIVIYLLCIQARFTTDAVALLLIISNVERVGHLTNHIM
jgi:ABC-type multidrug transport system fused ATPase/permease subunit